MAEPVPPPKPKLGPDPIFDSIGEAGKYQYFLVIFISVSKFPIGWWQLSSVFLAPNVEMHCEDPDNTTDICSPDCHKVVYDRSIFEQTITMEWDLICDKKNWPHYAQTTFMFGILVGNVGFGIWSDKQGRLIPFLVTCVMQLVSGLLASISPMYWLFTLSRFLCAVATGGNMMISFVICMEYVGPKQREILMTIIYQLPFNLGHALLSAFAYFTRHFRWYHFSLSIFSVIYVFYFCFCPESARWLINAGRVDEAVQILEKAAVINKYPKENVRPIVEEAARNLAGQGIIKKSKFYDLLRTPNVRKNTLCLLYAWFVVGFNYFGISAYCSTLAGDIFLNVACSALLGCSGVVISVPLCKYLGRKPTLILSNAIITISMICFIFVPSEYPKIGVVFASHGVFGAALTFPTVYLFGGELFPTVARNTGMGYCSMASRIGAMLAANAAILEVLGEWATPLLFASLSFFAVLCTLLLPETNGRPLPETFEDAENYGMKA